MADTAHDERRASTRIAELEERIEQATALIGELRETNYSLSGELAELRRELESRPAPESEASSSGGTGDGDGDGDVDVDVGADQAELDALRKERKTIRTKVARLLEKIEKLEAS